MSEAELKQKHDAALPNWMNPQKLRRIEAEFYGIGIKTKQKEIEKLLDEIYVREEANETMKGKEKAKG